MNKSLLSITTFSLFILAALPAAAYDGTVSGVIATNDRAYVLFSVPCPLSNKTDDKYRVDVSTPQGEAQLRIAIAAQLSGRAVSIGHGADLEGGLCALTWIALK